MISWTVACQAPLSTGFPWQEYQNGLPFPPPGDLPDPGIEFSYIEFFTTVPPGMPINYLLIVIIFFHVKKITSQLFI